MSDLFKKLPITTVDPIMIANAAWPEFSSKHPDAVNTTIGVMINQKTHKPWQPRTVTIARESALQEINKASAYGYQTQTGYGDFLNNAAKYVFGETLSKEHHNDMLAYETLGGTGALYLTKETLLEIIRRDVSGSIPLFLDPGWPNHPAIFAEPFSISSYEHLTPDGQYNHQAACMSLNSEKQKSIVGIFQVGGYNDDGADRTIREWQEIAEIAANKNMVVVLDAAYLGLAEGIEKDRLPIMEFIKRGVMTFVCASFSKNMGLYNERLGALFVANAGKNNDFNQRDNLHQCIMRIVRRTVSSAPRLSAQAASIALLDPDYLLEVEFARKKLQQNRMLFAAEIKSINPHVSIGHGMFTKVFTDGFTPEQVNYLAKQGILVLANSRINLGGMDAPQVTRVGQAIRAAT
jgi:aromatic-amino-acid transaminase